MNDWYKFQHHRMIAILLLTAATLIFLTYILIPRAKDSQVNTEILEEPFEPLVVKQKAVKKNDSHLRRVSISTNQVLFDSQFNFIPAMAQLLPVLSQKYRLYLITQVPNDGCAEHIQAQQNLHTLNDIQSHRIMYCSTDKGKESIVRQLSAEMHVDSDAVFCQNMQRFLSKIHLLNDDTKSDFIQKDSNGKIIWFRGVKAYCSKICQSVKQAQ